MPGASVTFSLAGIDATESYFVCRDNAALLAPDSLSFSSPLRFSLEAAPGCSAAAGCGVQVTVARDARCSSPLAHAKVLVRP